MGILDYVFSEPPPEGGLDFFISDFSRLSTIDEVGSFGSLLPGLELALNSTTMQQHYLALLLGAAWAAWNVDAAAFKPVSIE